MSSQQVSNPLTITQKTRVEFWSEIRSSVQKDLFRLVLVATFYLALSLAIGSFLLRMMEQVLRELIYIDGFSWEDMRFQNSHPEIDWIRSTYMIYLAGAVCLGVGSILILLFLTDKLPGWLGKWLARLPLIGSTMECLAAAELCQSVFCSVSENLPYDIAFRKASKNINYSFVNCWAEVAAARLEKGQALSAVVGSVPLRVPPMAVLSSMFANEKSREQALQSWESAAEESHFLSRARADRTSVFVSNIVLLVSVFIASYAIYCTASMLVMAIGGLT